MSKELWAISEAKKILKRCSQKKKVVFETGYGPSGLPHIGTFAEIARTNFVIEAMKQLDSSVCVRLIAFSDDKDGLRELPANIPNREELFSHLGKPVATIPDPFGETDSYAEYMNNKLCEFLDNFRLTYEFMSASRMYDGGKFDEFLVTLFDRYDETKKIFIQDISPEKREAWSPFLVICENCGKINTTSVKKKHTSDYRLEYSCDKTTENYSSCGYQGSRTILSGNAKVGWKVDWAMRWTALEVDYEMHGEDLTESVKTSSRLCKLLGGKPPETYKYELFLDEKGRKISKKIGNGISMRQWLSYAPLGALLYFLLDNPKKPKRMGLPILPELVDKYFQGLTCEDPEDCNSKIWFVNRFPECRQPIRPLKVTYGLLVNVASALGILEPRLLFEYAAKYDPSVVHDQEFYLPLCGQVLAYVRDYESLLPKKTYDGNTEYFRYLRQLRDYIAAEKKELQGEELQTFIFGLAKENDLSIKEWFRFLYNVLLQKESGPKMGPFFATLGREKSLCLIDKGCKI